TLTEAFLPANHRKSARFSFEAKPPSRDWQPPAGPYLNLPAPAPPDFEPFSFLRDQLGVIPKLFRAHMPMAEQLAAQIRFLEQIVHTEEALNRIQKEEMLLAVSASNLNTYAVALQRQVLDGLGVSHEKCDAIVDDLHSAPVSLADKALLAE